MVMNEPHIADTASEVGAADPGLTWLIGRLARVYPEAGYGFIRAASGALVYFSFGNVSEAAGALRPCVRVRYQPVGAGIPKAMAVATV